MMAKHWTPNECASAYDASMLRHAEEHCDELPDGDHDALCSDCGNHFHTANDAMLDTEHICSTCWILGNLDLIRPGNVDPVALQEMLDAITRSIELDLTLVKSYERHGMPTRKDGAWVL